jgi:hypothetical protein
LLALPAASADAIWVIGSRDAPVSALTRQQVAGLYLGLGMQDARLQPLDQGDPELREKFYRAVADLSTASVRAHWAKQVFTGRGRPPQTLATEVLERMADRNPAVVTYIPAGKLPPGSKILLILDSGTRP